MKTNMFVLKSVILEVFLGIISFVISLFCSLRYETWLMLCSLLH